MVKTVQDEKKVNPLMRLFGQKPKAPARKIIHSGELSKVDSERVVKLYDALVSSECTQPVDVDMIVTEAFPKFEETIGVKEFAKVKKHFGIGDKACSKAKPDIKINILLEQLKTIENAQYYITGYKELVSKMASKLLDAPEELTTLERAKLVRMFYIVLNDREYFVEDYRAHPTKINGEATNSVYHYDFDAAIANNKKPINPEEMFYLYEKWVSRVGGVFYQGIEFELTKIDRDLKKVFTFAELSYSKSEGFKNVNVRMANATFGSIRTLKKNINSEFYAYPLALFHDILWIEKMMELGDLYVYMRVFEDDDWMEKARVISQRTKVYSASIFVDSEVKFYEVTPNLVVSGPKEADRIKYFMDFAVEKEFVLPVKKIIVDENNQKTDEVDDHVNVAAFMAAIEIAKREGFFGYTSSVSQEFAIAETIIESENGLETLLDYKRKLITYEEAVKRLKIDENYAAEVLGLEVEKGDSKEIEVAEEIVPEVVAVESETEPEVIAEVEEFAEEVTCDSELIKTVIDFAVRCGYAESEEAVNLEIVQNVIVPGNEEFITALAAGEIDDSTFEKKIGFEDEFAEAYFDTAKIDIRVVEEKLQDIKKYGKKDKIKKSKLVVALYCYLVTNEIGCGPKNKPAKRNKGLKPQILMELIK